MNLTSILPAVLAFALAANLHADPLKIGGSNRPGFTVLEIAQQKGWFKEAGVDVELATTDYLSSIAAFSAGSVDAVAVAGTDALAAGANGAKSKLIALLDVSEGGDAIIGAAGVESMKDLKGRKVGVEVTLVEHLLLLQALKANGMKQSDIELVNTPANDTPQALASGTIAAVGAWQPIAGQALKAVAGSKPLFSSAEAKGLIYDVLAVNPASYAKNKDAWAKLVGIYYKCVDYLRDPQTANDAVAIMAAKAGADAAEYATNISGIHFLTRAEAKKAFRKGDGLGSIYGSLNVANKFNLENKVYKVSQKPENYVTPAIVEGLK